MAISITSPFLSMSEKVLEICRQIRCAGNVVVEAV